MRDHDGVEWLRPADAAERVDIDVGLVYLWVQRHKVRRHRMGGHVYVHLPDVMTAEHAWRAREQRRRAMIKGTTSTTRHEQGASP